MGALACGVRSYLNLSQLLSTHVCKAKYVRETYCRYFVHLQYFGFVLQILRALAVFQGSVLLRILSGWQYSGFATAAAVDTPVVLQVSRGSVLRVL